MGAWTWTPPGYKTRRSPLCKPEQLQEPLLLWLPKNTTMWNKTFVAHLNTYFQITVHLIHLNTLFKTKTAPQCRQKDLCYCRLDTSYSLCDLPLFTSLDTFAPIINKHFIQTWYCSIQPVWDEYRSKVGHLSRQPGIFCDKHSWDMKITSFHKNSVLYHKVLTYSTSSK